MDKLSLPADTLSELSSVVAARLGLNFPEERWTDLERNIFVTVKQNKLTPDEFIASLISNSLSQRQLEILASNLTVGETYFFRDKKFFESLEEFILPELINSRRNNNRYLRIWCAGCATGEEPYSVSMILHKLLPDIREWEITLLATDINPDFLKKMDNGIYNEWSFRDVPEFIKQKYFNKISDNRYKIHDEIKNIVSKKYLNLAEDCYPSLLNNTNAMDIIICRNVLMYFTPENCKKVIQCFYRSIVENGWLIVSPSETSQIYFKQYSTVNFPGVILYRKESNSQTSKNYFELQLNNDFNTNEQIPETRIDFNDVITVEAEEEILPSNDTAENAGLNQAVTYQEAKSQFERGNYLEAKELLKKYFHYYYNDPNAHSLLTRIYANEGNLREAFAWCEKAISLDRTNPLHHYLMASILQEQNRHEEAIAELKRVLYLDHNFVIGHFALGNISARVGKMKDSRKSFDNALKLLQQYPVDFVLPESDGMTANRLIEIIHTTTEVEI